MTCAMSVNHLFQFLILHRSLRRCATAHSIKIGLAIFRVLICRHNRINQKRFDTTLFFHPISSCRKAIKMLWAVAAFSGGCFQWRLSRHPSSSLLGGEARGMERRIVWSHWKMFVKTQCRVLWSCERSHFTQRQLSGDWEGSQRDRTSAYTFRVDMWAFDGPKASIL